MFVPSASFEVTSTAVPPPRLAVSSFFFPSLNVTVPIGAAVPGLAEMTVAVIVIAVCRYPGLDNALKITNVVTGLTVWEIAAELEPAKPTLPAYDAEIECPPSARALVVYVAEPPENAMVASGVGPSKNVMVPAGRRGPT